MCRDSSSAMNTGRIIKTKIVRKASLGNKKEEGLKNGNSLLTKNTKRKMLKSTFAKRLLKVETKACDAMYGNNKKKFLFMDSGIEISVVWKLIIVLPFLYCSV